MIHREVYLFYFKMVHLLVSYFSILGLYVVFKMSLMLIFDGDIFMLHKLLPYCESHVITDLFKNKFTQSLTNMSSVNTNSV
jgi:hypothetical protein